MAVKLQVLIENLKIKGVGRELLTCPYPLKVQACPPRDQRPAAQSRVSGQRIKIKIHLLYIPKY